MASLPVKPPPVAPDPLVNPAPGRRMPTLDDLDYRLHLPPVDPRIELNQDQEWCEIEIGGERRRIRFHDYAAIYEIPGLYERLFVEQLACNSPRIVTDLLRAQLRSARIKPERLTALDLGAGNGMVGELLAEHGIGDIVGVDLLPQAYDAASRDRPGLYENYYTLDLSQLQPDDRRNLVRHDFDVMTCVAALGFGDIPPLAFAEAMNLVASPGWIAFNIRTHFLEPDHPSGFGDFIARILDEGILKVRTRKRYTHRFSVSGEPLDYFAVIVEKHREVPLDWARRVAV